MKKFIIAIMCVLGIATVYAETSEITTSQYYVDTKLLEKQDAVPANNANSVMIYDSTSADGVGVKQIYDTTASYESQKTSLVTAGTANAAIQNAINMEFTCANPPKCTLWDMTGLYGRVPAGYTELEYLVGNGAQYIDTDILPNNNTGMKAKFNKYEAGDQVVAGVQKKGVFINSLYINPGLSIIWLAFASDGSQNCGPQAINTDFEVSINYMNDRKRYVNGVSKLDINTTLSPQTIPIYLFALNKGEEATRFFNGRIYYLKITDDQTLVRDMVPVRRNIDGELGMYDTITNTFFPNLGSGAFTAGPVASFIPQNQ